MINNLIKGGSTLATWVGRAGFWCVYAALMAVAVFFRVWRLGEVPGINGDEGWIGYQSLFLIQEKPYQWLGPTHRPTNIFFIGPLALLHLFFDPSFWLLRGVAAAGGIVSLPLFYVLCRKVYGTGTSLAVTLLLAVLPVNIADVRIGWENSQSILFCSMTLLLALYLSRPDTARWKLVAFSLFVVFGASVIVHVTNVFMAPFIAIAVGCRWQKPFVQWLKSSWVKSAIVLAAVSCLIYPLLQLPLVEASLNLIPERVTHGAAVAGFHYHLVGILSGAEPYQYFSGPGDAGGERARAIELLNPRNWTWPISMFGILSLGALLVPSRRGGVAPVQDRVLASGWIVSVAAFYLLGGPGAVRAPNYRFALWLVVPSALLLVRGTQVLWQQWPLGIVMARFVGLGGAALFLGSFYANYFDYVQRTGGQSERTFRTGPGEPKARIYQEILERARPDAPVYILASEWWNYQPIRYLAGRTPAVRVVQYRWEPGGSPGFVAGDRAILQNHYLAALSSGNVWHVEFTDSATWKELVAHKRVDAGSILTANDPVGRSILSAARAVR